MLAVHGGLGEWHSNTLASVGRSAAHVAYDKDRRVGPASCHNVLGLHRHRGQADPFASTEDRAQPIPLRDDGKLFQDCTISGAHALCLVGCNHSNVKASRAMLERWCC
jgi:hypothetical protein